MTTSLFGLVGSDFNVSLQWRSPIDTSLFTDFERIGKIDNDALETISPADDKYTVVTVGPVLSDLNNPTHAVLVSCVKDDEYLYWFLKEWTAPIEPPPEDIIKSSEKAGNYSSVIDLLSLALQAKKLSGSYEIRINLNLSDGWKCKLFNQLDTPVELNDLGSQIYNEEIGYRFEGGTSGLEEVSIVFDHAKNIYIINIDARSILEIDRKSDYLLSTPKELTELILDRGFELNKPL